MTAATGHRRDELAARGRSDPAAKRRMPSRIVAFALLCAASLALAGGYAWWSTARRASFVREVSLPPIDSLAELEAPLAVDGSAPPVGENPAPPAGVGTARPTGPGAPPPAGVGTSLLTGPGSLPPEETGSAPFAGAGAASPEETGSAPLTGAGSASPEGAAGSAPRPAPPRGDPAAPDPATARRPEDRLGAAGRPHAEPTANEDGPMPGRGDARPGAGGPAGASVFCSPGRRAPRAVP